MPTNLTLTRAAGTLNGERPRHAPATPPASRRNRTRIALGVVVIVLCVLGATTLYSRADNRVDVLGVRRPVPAGQVIAADDLRLVRVGIGANIQTVPASEFSRLVGRIAAVTLVPGALLSPEQITDAPRIPAGRAVAGVTLAPGRFPRSMVRGDKVLLVQTSASTATGDDAPPVALGRATVLDIADDPATQGQVDVSLLVATDDAMSVASASASARLSVVVVPTT
jgi:hypothetical protein